MDIKQFYLENIQEDEYHYRFIQRMNNYINNVYPGGYGNETYNFEIEDEEDAIFKFRQLCEPSLEIGELEAVWFYLLSYFLHKRGYYISEHPRVLKSPPFDPTEFTYDEIRTKIRKEGNYSGGKVAWADRRTYVDNLKFIKSTHYIDINYDIDEKFKEISNRNASFNSMSLEEKLAEIVNFIENVLKHGGKYNSINYPEAYREYVNEEILISYKKKMQAFRHAAQDSLFERNSYSDHEKEFFVNYGLVILHILKRLKGFVIFALLWICFLVRSLHGSFLIE